MIKDVLCTYRMPAIAVSAVPPSFIEKIPSDLHRIAEDLTALTRAWNVVEIVTASAASRKREKHIFVEAYNRGEIYHPRFAYPFADQLNMENAEIVLLELLNLVRTYRPASHAAAFAVRALRFKLQDDLSTVWLVHGIQTSNERLIGQALRSKYGGTDGALIRAAKADFARRVDEAIYPNQAFEPTALLLSLQTLTFTAPDVKDAFEWALDAYGILKREEYDPGFRVRIDESAAFIDVRDKSALGPTVFVPEEEHMTGDELIALIAHEIDGHARQTMNGELLLGVWNAILRVDDETYYEGLAMRYENAYKRQRFGIDARPSSLFAFAVRTAELGGSFHRIFDIQFRRQLRLTFGIQRPEPLPPKETIHPMIIEHALDAAWNTTYRVMRGHTDMSNPHHYAMPKDLAYLRGWLLDDALCSADRSHLNECGIMTHRGMELLQGFGLTREHVPIAYRDVASEYAQSLVA